MVRFRKIAVLIFLLVFSVSLGAQEQNPDMDPLVFKLMVIGASDEIFIWWGHATLIIENTKYDHSVIYDWGIFSYPSDSFLMDWIRDKVAYKCAVASAKPDIYGYIGEDRDIVVYVLDLEPDKKQAILDYAVNNVHPANCWYTYHPFEDNCATSIRNLIDLGTGGQLKERLSNTPGRFTYRQHLRRFIWFRTISDGFYSFLMGQDLDKNISAWEEMFLPIEIGRNVSDFKYIDSSGNERQLVTRVEMLNATKNRPPVLNEPLNQWPLAMFLGFTVTALLMGIITLRKKNPVSGSIAWGLAQTLLGLLFGISGVVLFFVMFFMKHEYFRNNFNLLLINPLILAAVPLGIGVMFGRGKPEKYLRLLWTYVFIADLVLMVMRLLPVFYQNNLTLQIVMLPISFLLSWNFNTNTPGICQYIRRLKYRPKNA